jgi:hypothetical protein
MDSESTPNLLLTEALHHALRSYKHGSPRAIPACLHDLLTVQSSLRAEHDAVVAAVGRVLADAMRQLSEQSPAHHDLLQRHYVRRQTMVQIARERAISERSAYGQQRDALAALATILERADDELAASLYTRSRANLPPRTYSRLFGHTAEAQTLAAYLLERTSCWMLVVDGMGGTGKTSLVRSVLEQMIEERAFRRLVWVMVHQRAYDGRTYSESAAAPLDDAALEYEIARQLGLPALAGLARGECRQKLSAELGRFPTVIVVDNLERAEDTQALAASLTGLTRPSKVVLVSRHRVDSYQACPITLRELSPAEALDFVRYHAWERHATAVLEAPDADLQRISDIADGNPLAIKLIIGQSFYRPLREVLTDLQRARGHTYDFYHFIYKYSWDNLSQQARHLLIHFPLMSPHGASWPHLAAVCGAPPDDPGARRAMDELVTVSLVHMSASSEAVYSIHRLTEYFLLSDIIKRWQPRR